MKQAVFFDIDGTLWDYRNFIPESTREAIRLLKSNGIYTFLNTGRTRAFVQNPDLLALGFDGIVSGCGTQIELGDRVLFLYEMPQEDIVKTVSSCRAHQFKMILEGAKYLYLTFEEFENDLYGQKVIRESQGRIFSIDDHFGNWQVSKVSCDTKESDDGSRMECYRELSDIFSFIVHDANVTEMVPKGFTKGTGIEKVCQLLDLAPENTFAFGDSTNDLEMLKAAGTAVVMGNGVEEAKNAADFVTAPLLEDGIFKACRHFDLI